ncbi:zinc ABC transporter substrate-binding protein [Roseibium algae]|uniref:High-affinity zinc uptake system protein ZnuA n=1 Tax=Roseibium algae TaxID=3123038 RepID=A0ABU8TR06_9HYPH
MLASYFTSPSFSRKKAFGASTVLAASLMFSASAYAAPQVVATIKPIHSLVAGVMEGVGTPEILIDGAASPHSFALKPSQASSLQNADVVFWVGENLETSLAKALESLPGKATVVELSETPKLELLPFRTNDGFGDHDEDEHHDGDHDDHGHDAHDDHDHDKADAHADHDHDKAESEEHADHDAHEEKHHDEAGHEGHHHTGLDPHIWLDPENAIILVDSIANSLSEADSENAATYQANAAKMKDHIAALETEIQTSLEPVRGRPFVVFHDAYHYFEDRFSIPASGAIALNPETPAGADRISDIRETVKDKGIVCVFSEPQFPAKLVTVVLEGSSAKTATLDPLGTDLQDGPGLYEALLRQIAKSMTTCLS